MNIEKVAVQTRGVPMVESVHVMLEVKVPVVVGVPDKAPAEDMVMPGGREGCQ
jgi:hypothetical protein